MSTSSVNISDAIAAKVNGAAMPLSLADQLAALKAENAKLKGEPELAQPTATTAPATDKPKPVMVPCPKSAFLNVYPKDISIQDKAILDTIHACWPKTVEAGPDGKTPLYPVPAVSGKELFGAFHDALIPNYRTLPKDVQTAKRLAINAKIQPFLDSAIARHIVTQTRGGTPGKGWSLYFDAREKASTTASSGLSDTVTVALNKAFGV